MFLAYLILRILRNSDPTWTEPQIMSVLSPQTPISISVSGNLDKQSTYFSTNSTHIVTQVYIYMHLDNMQPQLCTYIILNCCLHMGTNVLNK